MATRRARKKMATPAKSIAAAILDDDAATRKHNVVMHARRGRPKATICHDERGRRAERDFGRSGYGDSPTKGARQLRSCRTAQGGAVTTPKRKQEV